MGSLEPSREQPCGHIQNHEHIEVRIRGETDVVRNSGEVHFEDERRAEEVGARIYQIVKRTT